jgi:glycogen debranching enzyme
VQRTLLIAPAVEPGRAARPVRVSKAGSLFAVFDAAGDVDARERGEAGIYLDDTRFVDRLRLRVRGRRLDPVHVEGDGDRFTWDLALPDAAGRPLLEVRRTRLLADPVRETIVVRNPGPRTFTGTLRLDVAGDFRSMFSVRGVPGPRPGRLTEAWDERSGTLTYHGADGRTRTTRAALAPAPAALDRGRARHRLRLAPGTAVTLDLELTLRVDGRPVRSPPPPGGLLRQTAVETDVPAFDRVLDVALRDLRMLVSWQDGLAFLAAGVPWFVALFGRDSIISALQCLAFEPAIARDTLRLLAGHRGRRVDVAREEEPGKILHELRRDELSNLGRLPFGPYFGTVDATPLFLVLLGRYVAWTGDLGLWHELRCAAESALTWMRRYGDHDGDGFLDYEGHDPDGLSNQGWKDSGNCIVNRDGSLARAPIAPVEVQAYAHRALLETAALYRASGEEGAAAGLEREARSLRRRFMEAYWMPDRRYLAMALERDGRRVETIASNAGHALWTGTLPAAHGRLVARRLMDPSMFSGWGVRTLAEGEPRYDPTDYQVGAVWPHDSALAAAGLARYGRRRDFERLFTAMVEAALQFPDQRLPELFGGHRRQRGAAPVPYPVAASPQAWAAGTVPFLLVTALGLEPDAVHGRLIVREPVLPRWLGTVRVRGLRVGGQPVDLEWRRAAGRTEVVVRDAPAGLEVVVRRPGSVHPAA